MATPLGHTLAGFLCTRHHAELATPKRRLAVLAYFILFANLPDFDFIPGILMGDPWAFHRGVTHTVFFAALVSGITFVVFASRDARAATWWAGVTFVAVASHLFLDLLTATPQSGLALMWPLSDRLFYPASPVMESLNPASPITLDQIRIVGREAALLAGAILLRDAYVEIRFGRIGPARSLSRTLLTAVRPLSFHLGSGRGLAAMGMVIFFGAVLFLDRDPSPAISPSPVEQNIQLIGNATEPVVSNESLVVTPLSPSGDEPGEAVAEESEPMRTAESMSNGRV